MADSGNRESSADSGAASAGDDEAVKAAGSAVARLLRPEPEPEPELELEPRLGNGISGELSADDTGGGRGRGGVTELALNELRLVRGPLPREWGRGLTPDWVVFGSLALVLPVW